MLYPFFADSVTRRSELAVETMKLFLYMFARMHHGDRISNDLSWESSKKIGHHSVGEGLTSSVYLTIPVNHTYHCYLNTIIYANDIIHGNDYREIEFFEIPLLHENPWTPWHRVERVERMFRVLLISIFPIRLN